MGTGLGDVPRRIEGPAAALRSGLDAGTVHRARPDDEFVWRGFWFGMLKQYRVNSSQLHCPEAHDPVTYEPGSGGGINGGGTANNAWSGQHQTTTPVGIRLDTSTRINNTLDTSKRGYRTGSYGFNGNCYARRTSSRTAARATTAAVAADPGHRFEPAVRREHRAGQALERSADLLRSRVDRERRHEERRTPDHRPTAARRTSAAMSAANSGVRNTGASCIDRHNRAINVCFADGTCASVSPLEDNTR